MANKDTLSIADFLFSAVYFGDETLTIRMSEKYNSGAYTKGPVILQSRNGSELEVELTSVPEASEGNPDGATKIRNLTADDIRRNGYPLPLQASEAELQHAKEFLAENLKRYYPVEKGYKHEGLDTEVFTIGWSAPEHAATLREMRDQLKTIVPQTVKQALDAKDLFFEFVPKTGRGGGFGVDYDLLVVTYACERDTAGMKDQSLLQKKLEGIFTPLPSVENVSKRVIDIENFNRQDTNGFVIVVDYDNLDADMKALKKATQKPVPKKAKRPAPGR